MRVDRNARARLVFQAEAYEKRTKAKGSRTGDLYPSGIQLLRIIAFRFLDLARGAAYPSYDALQAATGLCRQCIADAIKRLEAAGFLLVTRRAGIIGRKLVKETNLYMLPVEPPALPEWESLLSERDSESLERVSYEQLTGPLKDALERLGDAMAKRAAAVT